MWPKMWPNDQQKWSTAKPRDQTRDQMIKKCDDTFEMLESKHAKESNKVNQITLNFAELEDKDEKVDKKASQVKEDLLVSFTKSVAER